MINGYQIKPLVTAGLIACINYSCRTTTYVPNVINAPLFQQPKEFHGSGYLSFNHAEFQSAYAMDSTFGFIADFYTLFPVSQGDTTGFLTSAFTYRRGYLAEAGMVLQKKIYPHTKIEGLAGYGYGEKYFRKSRFGFMGYDRYFVNIGLNYHRFFLQGNAGWLLKWWNTGITVRISYLYFNSLDYYFYNSRTEGSPPQTKTIEGTEWYNYRYFNMVTMEPAYIARIKLGPSVEYIFETGMLIPLVNDPVTKHFAYNISNGDAWFFNTGLYIIIPGVKR